MDEQKQDQSDNDAIPATSLETKEVNDGLKPVTTLVGKDGRIAFPGPIPPAINSPESPLSPREANPNNDADGKPRIKPEPTIEGSSRPSSPEKTVQKSKTTDPEARPDNRTWNTELPRSSVQTDFAFRPPPPRAGTSYLNRAIWEGPRAGHGSFSSSSSSSSSSSEEADGGLEHGSQQGVGPQKRRHVHKKTSEPSKDKDKYGKFSVGNQNYRTSGKVKKDGRLRITVNETANKGYLAKALGTAMNKVIAAKEDGQDGQLPLEREPRNELLTPAQPMDIEIGPRPRLNIVIMVIGSRGDAQPFLKIGKVLKEQYGHRVRIATHPAFRDFVEKDSGLEFFSVGGDPSELMAFMVKNPGLIPKLETVKAGDIGRRRAAMAEMFDGFWRACINATDDEKDKHNLKMMGAKDPFVADAIIANPPSFAHIHCAEALGIPLHLMFTFPYTPTQAFPHPLASIKRSNVDAGYTNFISYPLVEMMVWQGLGDLVNDFRVKTLALDPVSTIWAPGASFRLHVPFTYMWSPGLVPKPEDWGSEVSVSGFVFLDLASSFTPPKELEDFLAAGEEPIYIGFGSIVVDDPDRFTQMIFDAVKKAGVRALVSKGWGGLGCDDVPDNVFMLDNTPHDWLFPRIKACVIHGGAGTTAIALKCGKPTMVVPFFGDQHFWGKMLANANVGPEPVPYKHLDCDKLVEGIEYCLTDKAREAAEVIAKDIEEEGDGAENAVKQFHRQLNLRGPTSMRCSILKDQPAVWELKDSHIRLSPIAADVLVDKGTLNWKRLRLHRHVEWNDFEGPGEPVTGIAGSLAGTVGEAFSGIASVPFRWAKRTKSRKKKKEKRERRASMKQDREKKQKQQQNGTTPHSRQGSPQTDDEGQNDTDNGLDTASMITDTTVDEAPGEYVGDVASGVERTATAIAKAPVDLSMALAQGFHNAPRLYGDNTVRRPPRVTGFKSGLKAARFELMYGVYDGVTGVVRLPVKGAKEQGVVGFVKGTGMGLTGLVLKNLSAVVSPFGYTLKGVVKQAERHKTPQRAIRRARIVQGQRDFKELPEDRRKKISKETMDGWNVLRDLSEMVKDIEHKRGLAGQIDRVTLDMSTLFEGVETAKKALQALKEGETIESVLHPERETRGRDGLHGTSDKRNRSIRRSLNFGRKSRDERRPSAAQKREDDLKEQDETGEGEKQGETRYARSATQSMT